MKAIEASLKDLALVRAILHRHVPGVRVLAFGSRVAGSARRFSDLDLVLMASSPIGFERMAAMRDEFSDSDLPFRVDLVDWSVLGPRLRKRVEGEAVVLIDEA